jgi:hypothetical protein
MNSFSEFERLRVDRADSMCLPILMGLLFYMRQLFQPVL